MPHHVSHSTWQAPVVAKALNGVHPSPDFALRVLNLVLL